MPIDGDLPEIEVARVIARRLKVPGAFEMIPLVGDKVKLVACGAAKPARSTRRCAS